ncbi:protein tyrosine phosphatase domain-containing protein 1 [Betta splendens]|uniref:Protein tyrosine phosphatase domain-containing protein 1 n=1 Tax=Betta splendens TaxID=158456 RepID=A0A6P7MW63_BETSP|nr:protein tyrosine phosphatase domain-containing protein 1 [Betta splendens]XP_029011207.1 protein tyrosine phosphatase domain-containing protein 1 [Betta splendens]XP_029011208.1 protein tyrosine phosphatase domain-containing protein 1 [Betta splendens]XP_029011209.1 protein tyrosine phosphatase domain-containing protein 1 [Betta splendens]XP_029011210.1 protein tyrosine phosphatase domain-containing protein 1 [Betta splendens]XP_040927617.1 protein tyrosine phosphatase domain-containing pro
MAKSTGGTLMEYITAPRAKYTMVGEAIRYVIPSHMQCSLGCGGQDCKYDNPSYWRDDQQAIKGLYSSWITEHLLAMSRPSTEIIEKYNIIDQFKRAGIKTVINLQIPGEHASCGNPLEPESGFSYRPEFFMENNIYFYNFGWDDYGVANLTCVLDMLKVMAFALQDGRIAVHCHAGLGRTGVLVACFLAYATRMTANQAISYVRAKRPNSIQTRSQLRCVRQFVQFLDPLRSVFSCAEPRTGPVTLSQYLNRQRHILHGNERKKLRHLPKIVQLVCRLLLDIAENRQVIEEDILEAPDVHDIEETLSMVKKLGPEAFAQEPRLPGVPTLHRHFNEPPIFYHRKSLSYSESDLRRLGSDFNVLTQPLQTGSLWQIKDIENQKDGRIVLERVKHKSIQRSESVGHHQAANMGSVLSQWKAEQSRELKMNGPKGAGAEWEVPFITLQSELSLEARRLLVAQALAVDLALDGDKAHRSRVLTWQAELNQGGAWERLCMERDPFILTGLMWAWLEQLKEPIVSVQDVEALTHDPDADPQTVLNTLDPAQTQTLTCILDCMAHMGKIPQRVENAFLSRTVKALAWMDTNKEESKASMTKVLRRLLEGMRQTRTTG